MKEWLKVGLQRMTMHAGTSVKQLVVLASTHVASRRDLEGMDTKAIRFTSQFHGIAKARGLSERDALDVLHHGAPIGENQRVRECDGYDVGVYFFVHPEKKQTVITSIWRRDRRPDSPHGEA